MKLVRISLLILGGCALLASSASAQSLSAYLKQRHKYSIHAAAGVAALDTLVGNRVLEISGTVKGTFRIGSHTQLMVDRGDNGTLIIDAASIPDWLSGNEVPARLLVKAHRSTADTELQAYLIVAAPDSVISEVEKKESVIEEARARRQPALAPPKTLAARRYWSMPASMVTPVYAQFIRKCNRRLSQVEAADIARAILGFSQEYGVDARLIMAMVMVESGFDPTSTSRSGAMGLGQLMPGTAKWMGVNNAYDSTQNLYGTVKLIHTHLNQYRRQTGDNFRSLVLALAAYNAGVGAVSRHGGVPPYRETQAYVRKVIGLYNKFCGG